MAVNGLPPGSLMALRMNFDRLRVSRLERPLRTLLSRIPEWRFLLEGSELDPLRDLSRLMLVMADPRRRDQLIASGELAANAPSPETIAARMASTRGEIAEFVPQDGLSVATWHDVDPVDRIVAATGGQTFLIANRAMSLATLIRWAETRAHDLQRTCSGAECMRSLGDAPEGVDAEFEIQGAAAYFAYNDGHFPFTLCEVPDTLQVRMHEDETGIHVRIEGRYADPERAREAAGCLHLVREQFRDPVTIAGFNRPLEQMQFHTEEQLLQLETNLTLSEAELLILLITGLLPQ